MSDLSIPPLEIPPLSIEQEARRTPQDEPVPSKDKAPRRPTKSVLGVPVRSQEQDLAEARQFREQSDQLTAARRATALKATQWLYSLTANPKPFVQFLFDLAIEKKLDGSQLGPGFIAQRQPQKS